MSTEKLLEGSRRLEGAFFQERHADPLEALRLEEAQARELLAEASDIDDDALFGRLAALGIRVETLAALTLVPLVEVAWADGKMDPAERDAVLRGAESSGIAAGSPSHTLLAIWTRERPANELIQSWRAYIAALGAELSSRQRAHLCERLVGRARAVAEAAGGLRGRDSVSPEEEAVLSAMRSAFA